MQGVLRGGEGADRAVAAPRRSAAPLLWVVLALLLVPFAVAAVRLVADLGGDYHAFGDHAALEARVRDVGRHPVLTGLYSRDDWSHPGPAVFYVMAVPYLLSGGATASLVVGALLVNGASMAGMVLVARRLGGTPAFVLTAIGCAVLVRSLELGFLADPWNPYVTVLPFGLLLFLTWAMACGERWAMPVAAAVATFCAQTHIGYMPLALPLFAFGVVVLVRRRRRGATAPGSGPGSTAGSGASSKGVERVAVLTAVVLAVLWLPPVIEQLTNEPGNLGQIVLYFRTPSGEQHTLAEGLRVVTGEFGWRAQWIAGAESADFIGEHPYGPAAPVPVLLIPFAVALVALRRRRARTPLWLGATAVVAMVLGVVSVARTVGVLYAYRLRWTWVIAMAGAVVTAWAVWSVVADRRSDRGGDPGAIGGDGDGGDGGDRRREPGSLTAAVGRSPAAFAGLVALLVLGAVNVVDGATVDAPNERQSGVVSELLRPVVGSLPPGGDPVLVQSPPSLGSTGYAAGLTLALERSGVDVRTIQFDERAWGEHRIHEGERLRARFSVVVDEEIDKAAATAGARRVAYWGMPEEQRAARSRRLRELDAAHDAGTLAAGPWILERRATMPSESAVAVYRLPD